MPKCKYCGSNSFRTTTYTVTFRYYDPNGEHVRREEKWIYEYGECPDCCILIVRDEKI